MLSRFLYCFSSNNTAKIVPISDSDIEPSTITKLNKMRDVYTKIITDIQFGKVTYLTSNILDDIYTNKGHIKGLINELYTISGEDIAYGYTKTFDRLDVMLSSTVRRLFYKNELRISKSLMERRDIQELLSLKTKQHFSAEF